MNNINCRIRFNCLAPCSAVSCTARESLSPLGLENDIAAATTTRSVQLDEPGLLRQLVEVLSKTLVDWVTTMNTLSLRTPDVTSTT